MFDLFDITAKRAALNPDKTAMTDAVTGREVSYAELDDNASKTAALLKAYDVNAGDRVAVLGHNCIEFFELLFACGKIGAILVPLNWRMPVAELLPLVKDSDPKLLFHDEDFAEAAAGLGVAVVPLSHGTKSMVSRRKGLLPVAGRRVWPADEPWYLLYTSGTTGAPKAVIQTYGMALVNYINIGQAVDIRSTDNTLNYLPLFHTAGINLYTLPVLIAGGTVLVMPGFDPDQMIQLIADKKLSIFIGVPAIYQQLSLHKLFAETDFTLVRSWACGGAPLPDVLVEQFLAKGVSVCNGCGMTETGPTVFLMDAGHVRTKIGSVGKPQILVDVRLVDEAGADVPPGDVGELWIAGPGITPGYWNRPEATRATFAEGGWLKSGDLARQDEDGFYYIVGRSKEMFISGGENVYPAEVENVLSDHEAVLEVAVIPTADERWGEVGHAYFMLRPGYDEPDVRDLIAFCRERLAAYKVPKAYHVVQDFPRTAAGKIQKHLITG